MELCIREVGRPKVLFAAACAAVCKLFGKKGIVPFTVIALGFVFLGTLASNDLVWELADMFSNLRVIPNAIALFALSKLVGDNVKK